MLWEESLGPRGGGVHSVRHSHHHSTRTGHHRTTASKKDGLFRIECSARYPPDGKRTQYDILGCLIRANYTNVIISAHTYLFIYCSTILSNYALIRLIDSSRKLASMWCELKFSPWNQQEQSCAKTDFEGVEWTSFRRRCHNEVYMNKFLQSLIKHPLI
jgi:hypothetical protein